MLLETILYGSPATNAVGYSSGSGLLDCENLHPTLFRNGCQFTPLEFHLLYALTNNWHSQTLKFLAIGWLINDLIKISFCVWPINNEVKCLFLSLLAICILCLMKYLFRSFVSLSFSYWVLGVFYRFWILLLCWLHVLQISFPSLWLVFCCFYNNTRITQVLS